MQQYGVFHIITLYFLYPEPLIFSTSCANIQNAHASVAQSAEHPLGKGEVGGSSPLGSSIATGENPHGLSFADFAYCGVNGYLLPFSYPLMFY